MDKITDNNKLATLYVNVIVLFNPCLSTDYKRKVFLYFEQILEKLDEQQRFLRRLATSSGAGDEEEDEDDPLDIQQIDTVEAMQAFGDRIKNDQSYRRKLV